MAAFTFELVSQKPARRREREAVFLLLVGRAGPFGEVSLTISRFPREARLVGEGLPEATISHPDVLKRRYIALDSQTRLIVGGVTAGISQHRRAFRREDRGLGITLGEREYIYLCTEEGEELRHRERGPVVRRGSVDATAGPKFTMVVLPEADPTDLALALVMQGADTRARIGL
ncbi:hypothetical protein [Microbispora bryophytorum]|uniref:hypothetical protein n=1 Tax=Microbispora bryophytorum TaxID=1460882 RepID=UPI0033FC5C13